VRLHFTCSFNIQIPFSFRADSIERLKTKCAPLELEIRDPNKFRDFYHFTFNYAKNPSQKGLGKFWCIGSLYFMWNIYYLQILTWRWHIGILF
jgi:hypothetical protein